MSDELFPGDLMTKETQFGNPLVFNGRIGPDDNVNFYLNLENNLFLCLAIGGSETKVTGKITKEEEGLYTCSAIWGFMPNIGWIDTSLQNSKTLTIIGNFEKVIFQCCELTRI